MVDSRVNKIRVVTQARFYEEGMIRKGVTQAHVGVDNATQTDEPAPPMVVADEHTHIRAAGFTPRDPQQWARSLRPRVLILTTAMHILEEAATAMAWAVAARSNP